MAETALVEHQQHLMLGDDSTRLQYAGSLSVDDILGLPDGEKSLGFETAHVFAVHSDAPSRPIVEVQFGGEPVHGKRFLDLLDIVAPAPFRFRDDRDTVRGILGDWVVYEGEDDRMKELAAQHSGLKGWTQLGKEYPDLKAALEPAAEGRPIPWMLEGNERIIKPERFITNWGDAEMFGSHAPLVETPALFQLLTDVYGADEARLRVIYAMRASAEEKQHKGAEGLQALSDDELFDRFHAFGIEERNRLIGVGLLQSNLEPLGSGGRSWSRSALTEKFSALYLERHCVKFETEDGQVMYADGISQHEDIQRAYDNRQRVYVGTDRPRRWVYDQGAAFEYELMDVDTVIGRQTAILPGSITFQETGLVPTVRWTRDANDKRDYQNLPEHPAFTSYRQDVRSGITGLMVLAYLQPEKRAHWHTERRLPGGKRTQEMGPAQVPLLALQHARRLIDNELMEQAEELVLA